MLNRRLACMAALVTVLAAPLFATASTFPERPIRLVVPYPAGGTTDVVARTIARNMSASLGQEVIVDNRAGAATVIGVQTVSKAPADGYTILLATATSFAVNPHIYKQLPYNLDEFVHIGFISEAPIVLVSPPSMQAQTLPELVAYLKGEDTAVATTGKGGFSHLTAAMFFNAIGAQYRDVAYRGEAPAIQDVLAGQINLYFGSMPGTMPHVRANRLRGYAVTSVERSPAAKDIPSFTEMGLPQVVATSWFGLSAPKGTPDAAVQALARALDKAMQDPDLRSRLMADGAVPRTMDPKAFADYIRADHERWGHIVRAANVQLD